MSRPVVIKHPRRIRRIILSCKSKQKTIGFVPTMGALHEGHLSLIERARDENDIVVVSIFVNPSQFAPGEDYSRYPRPFRKDMERCSEAGVDYLFYPSARQMYPEDYSTWVDVKGLSQLLCGKFRPVHFRGVVTVVLKLFHMVMPDIAYFGKKDYQQFVIIKKMAKDLNLNITIKGMPIIREKDGLAKSSRNQYLTENQRRESLLLYRSLKEARQAIQKGLKDPQKVIRMLKRTLFSGPVIKHKDIDYIAVFHPDTLEEVKTIKKKCVIALAVRVGKARLIDNIEVTI
ncbi:MAG: pantoate--beta-alanine ligase [Spirochaetes bacterium]|nr:pantoate--beta-alanine ligase [Spirochaetota bacterium]